jgi:NTP pyrophosphatase (non-canonical NTP hydrolase)
MVMKTISEMRREVDEYQKQMGWGPVSFPEAMALLHSEVSEALEAWRDHGFEDYTGYVIVTGGLPTRVDNPKPEGVGAEFADVLIRLLDDCNRFGVDIEKRFSEFDGRFGINDSFAVNLNTLHMMIAKVSMCWEDENSGPVLNEWWNWQHVITYVLVFLWQLCEHYGIDLEAEYERKMAYNRTRPYRHGGKRI